MSTDAEQVPSPWPADFAVDAHPADAGVVDVTVRGAVDMLTAPPVAKALQQAQQQAVAVRLDLRQVSFLGSAGLSALVDAARRADQSGTRLAIVADQHTVLHAVQVTGLDKVLHIYAEPDQAQAYLRPAG